MLHWGKKVCTNAERTLLNFPAPERLGESHFSAHLWAIIESAHAMLLALRRVERPAISKAQVKSSTEVIIESPGHAKTFLG